MKEFKENVVDGYNDENLNKNCNVDPTKYRILKEKRINGYIILKLAYIVDSDNQNTKILLFKNCTLLDIVQQKDGIHPEFFDNSELIYPIAIFKPDDEGWKMAEFLSENLK